MISVPYPTYEEAQNWANRLGGLAKKAQLDREVLAGTGKWFIMRETSNHGRVFLRPEFSKRAGSWWTIDLAGAVRYDTEAEAEANKPDGSEAVHIKALV